MADYIDSAAGTPAYGSIEVTINAVVYILETGGATKASRNLVWNDKTGTPNKSVNIAGLVTGSGTLQLADSTTAIPDVNDTFTADFGRGSKTYFITSVGKQFDQMNAVKVPVSYQQKIN